MRVFDEGLTQREIAGKIGATQMQVSGQAKAMLATVRPRDIAGKTRRRIAAEELADLVVIESKMKAATAELKAIVLARESRLMDIHGIGRVVAARILADVGDINRFADRNRFASSGENNRHRLCRAGTDG